jgi:hypothetical protein
LLGEDAPRLLKPVVHSILLNRTPGSSLAQIILALVFLESYLALLEVDPSLLLGEQSSDDLRGCVLAAAGFIKDRDSRLALLSSRIMSKFVGQPKFKDAAIMSIILSKGFEFLLLIRRVNHVSREIREISLSSIGQFPPEETMKLPDHPTTDHKAKMSILRIPFIGSIRSLHFDSILASLFGMAEKFPGYRNNLALDVSGDDDLDWLVRIYHTSQTSHYLSILSVDSSLELLLFWATWSVCQYLVIGKLKTCFGNAGQVFSILLIVDARGIGTATLGHDWGCGIFTFY